MYPGIAAMLACVAVTVPSAQARGLKVGFAEDSLFRAPPSQRSFLFGQLEDARAQILRIDVRWRNVVNPAAPPADPTNPADPDYYWSLTDAVVEAAAAHHVPVMITVLGAPDWAEGGHRPPGDAVPPGAWKPNARELGQFAQALGERYSGHYQGLPRVRYFEVWNEPNITKYLAPQWRGKRAASPTLYRGMLNRFYAGVKRAQPGAQVIGGSMSPFGDPRRHPLDPSRPRIRPLVFLRNLLCLKSSLEPKRCGTKPHFDVLSQHPLNFNQPPSYHPYNSNDVQVANFASVRRTLRAGERARNIRPGGHHQLWATESEWYTNPPNPTGVSLSKQAKWVERGLYMLWKQGASAVVNYPFQDDPRSQPISRWATSGALFLNGDRKPSFQSFRFPFVTHRESNENVGVWSVAPASGVLEIQRAQGKRWRTMGRVRVHRGEVATSTIRIASEAKLRGRVGKYTSPVWKQR